MDFLIFFHLRTSLVHSFSWNLFSLDVEFWAVEFSSFLSALEKDPGFHGCWWETQWFGSLFPYKEHVIFLWLVAGFFSPWIYFFFLTIWLCSRWIPLSLSCLGFPELFGSAGLLVLANVGNVHILFLQILIFLLPLEFLWHESDSVSQFLYGSVHLKKKIVFPIRFNHVYGSIFRFTDSSFITSLWLNLLVSSFFL